MFNYTYYLEGIFQNGIYSTYIIHTASFLQKIIHTFK